MTALPAREAGAQEDTAGGTLSPMKLSVDCVKDNTGVYMLGRLPGTCSQEGANTLARMRGVKKH